MTPQQTARPIESSRRAVFDFFSCSRPQFPRPVPKMDSRSTKRSDGGSLSVVEIYDVSP